MLKSEQPFLKLRAESLSYASDVTFIKETSTVERPHAALSSIRIPRFSFEIVSEIGKGQRFVFEPKTLRRAHVGRSHACELRLADGRVSLRHAALDLVDGRLRLTDLASLNGTFVENVRIGSAFPSAGEVLRFADTCVRLDVELSEVATTLPEATRFGRVIGASPEMRGLYVACEELALEDHPVLIEGEIGTGKELLAEALHEVGPRASGPFVVFDCAVIAPSDARAILFGVEAEGRPSMFEQADGGTLLIDEIGDLDAGVQGDLFRVLEHRELKRVGGLVSKKVDVRVLATTTQDLEREVESGHFRQDLYYRLAEHRVDVPPLRQRSGDIVLLATHFWEAMGGAGPLPEEFLRRARDYAWPGNVQELMNAVARRFALGFEAVSERADGSAPASADVIADVIQQELAFPNARRRVLDAFEGRYLKWILAKHGGNITRAAAAAGIARRYFYAVRSRSEI